MTVVPILSQINWVDPFRAFLGGVEALAILALLVLLLVGWGRGVATDTNGSK